MAETPLKILIVTQYFWPENMRINDLVEGFVKKGHNVTVLTGFPNYPEGHIFPEYKKEPRNFLNYRGAIVVRVPMLPRGQNSLRLVLNYLSFFFLGSVFGPIALRKEKFDVVFVYGVSPIMSAIPAIIIGKLKKARVFIWVLDLWPDTLAAVGVVTNKFLLHMVGLVVSWIYNRADYLLMQSRAFEQNIKKYCTRKISEKRLVYFPSWAEDDFSTKAAASSDLLERDTSVFTIVFAGNIGHAQDFPTILNAVEKLKDDAKVRWVIVGDGRAHAWLQNEVSKRNLENVLLLGRHPLEKMPALFAAADALFVSLLTNDVFSRTIPGKVQAYMASGKPLLGLIDGEAARVIEESGAGLASPSGNSDALAKAVNEMIQKNREELEEMGRAGRKYYEAHFSKHRLFDQLECLFRNSDLRSDES